MTIRKKFLKFVLQNTLGTIGVSLYILADTYFISKAQGTDGITALNLVLPIYNIIFAVGAMLGIGSAIKFTIHRARNEKQADRYFSNAIFSAIIFSIPFIIVGILLPDKLITLLGGNAQIVEVGTRYTRIFMLFTPFFMCNHICNAYVRNDGNATVAMAAMLASSFFNIVMDYILMFPLNLGMEGAALATGISPVIGIGICFIHFKSKKNSVKFLMTKPSARVTFDSCRFGVSAFIGEFASGVTTVVFNTIILGIAGNVGVAAYSVIANTALVAIAVFNGVSQGTQPLFSQYYGEGKKAFVNKVLKMGLTTVIIMALLMIITGYTCGHEIVGIFNSENNLAMEELAVRGLKIYFIGFIFAGINIIGTGYLAATESAGWASAASILRGIAAITAFACVLPIFFQLDGVWLAFPAAELLTVCVTGFGMSRGLH